MRVVRIIARLNIGGPARQVVVLDQELRALGCETTLVYGAPGPTEGTLEDLAVARGVSTIAMPTLGRRISIVRDAVTTVRLMRIIFETQPDVVHTHTAKAGTLGRTAAMIYNMTRRRPRRCAVVHTFHGNVFSGYFGALGSQFVRAAERMLARTTDRIITLSAQQRDEITERFGIAVMEKVAVVGAGHDLDPLLALSPSDGHARRTLGWTSEHVVIGYVGRLVAIKDLPTLVRAFARVAAACPTARLLVAGDGDQRATLERLVAELGITDIARFLGWSTDLPRLYATLDIVALTSLNEGMPASLIEGMAAGRAVLATRVGGVPELVADGENGLLATAGDVEAVACAMRTLIDDASLRATLGAKARATVGERFAPTRFARETLHVYQAALLSRRGSPSPLPLAPSPEL